MNICNAHAPIAYVLYQEDNGCPLCCEGISFDNLDRRYLALENELVRIQNEK